MLELQWLHMIHITIIVMQVPAGICNLWTDILERLQWYTNLASDDRSFSWASRAARASSSSYRLQLYQDEPCGCHDPRHTQQKSCLQFWFLHTCKLLKLNLVLLLFIEINNIYHMIASAIFLNGHITLGTLFSVCCNPIGSFRVIIALLDPFFKQTTLYRVMPILAAFEAENMATLTFHRTSLNVQHLYGVRTIGWWTPT